MSSKLDNVVKLKSGLNVGYAEYGPADGHPVFQFHGLPSCRLEAGHMGQSLIEVLEKLNIRLIAPDRPGIGLSDWRKYSIADYPDDVTELADILGIDKFSVIGVSSGPKFVAACAWKIPERLTKATMVSSTAPFNLPGVKDSYTKQGKMTYTIAGMAPWLMRIMLNKQARDGRKDIDKLMEDSLDMYGEMPEIDLNYFTDKESLETMMEGFFEALRQGARGAAHDFYIEAKPWGFDLSEIDFPVQIIHGGLDVACPAELGPILADAIPNSSYKEYPEDGHSLFFYHVEEMYSTLLPD